MQAERRVTACNWSRRHLDQLAAGELTIDQRAALLSHLRACSTCRNVYAASRRALRQLRRIGEVALPPDFEARLSRCLLEQKASGFPWVPAGLALLLTAAALSLGWGLLRRQSVSSAPVSPASRAATWPLPDPAWVVRGPERERLPAAAADQAGTRSRPVPKPAPPNPPDARRLLFVDGMGPEAVVVETRL